MVLVGGSPSLKTDVEKLKDLDDNFCIIVCNSALKYLLKHGVRPQYVICLDSDHIDIPQHLDCDSEGITLLASSSVCPKALDNWKGPIYYMAYYSIDPELRPKLRSRLGKKVIGGGNSITQALIVATIIWGSRTVIFVGNEFCFDDNYYADTEAAKQEKLTMLYPCVDVLGRERWTLPALYTYSMWMNKSCNDLTPPGYFIDTSFGLLGKDNPAIHVVELSEAIKMVKQAFADRDKLNAAKGEEDKETFLKSLMGEIKPSPVLRWTFADHKDEMMKLVRR